MNVLHLTCSPRGAASASTRLSELIVRGLVDKAPDSVVMRRDLGLAPPPHVDMAYAQALIGQPADADAASMALSETLIAELEQADCLVIGTPMHNFTVPSPLKAWIDHVVRIRRTFRSLPEGKVGLLPDRPVLIAVAAGGFYAGDTARQPDFLTPYLVAILGTIGLHDVTFFPLQGVTRGADMVAAAWDHAEHNVRRKLAAMSAGMDRVAAVGSD
ncbi:MAG TPA: NAD(P)H-dependent oxidoreductase [Rhodopila sp.]|uniref:FMN-dependent NADH-azoreductase n=1 Tax=Rhodopila sp. TaxID=2480087 RepID=UPI002CEC430B|nr:NAD(P)H-dependent oxidoreductase [Rhodopila sp.]HVY15232.1 NAD(P)H-dependent oxidoreductase [Rhodopila sp.]